MLTEACPENVLDAVVHEYLILVGSYVFGDVDANHLLWAWGVVYSVLEEARNQDGPHL